MKIISENDSTSPKIAAKFLQEGKLISFATDTVYGVACNAEDETAVTKLYELKNRNSNKPIAVFLKDLHQADKIFELDNLSRKIAKEFLPGALTIVAHLQNSSELKISKKLYKSDNFLGFRIVATKFIQELMENFDGILAVTSANISGFEAARNAKDVEKYFQNSKLDLLVVGADLDGRSPSTVVKIFDNKFEILRAGEISEHNILKHISNG